MPTALGAAISASRRCSRPISAVASYRAFSTPKVDCGSTPTRASCTRTGRRYSNLFAGGGAASGISGRAGALGYASGNGLLTAIALGRIAGLAAASEIAARPMTIARELVRKWRQAPVLPGDVVHAAKMHLLDSIGVGLAASRQHVGEPYRRFAAEIANGGPASIFGASGGASAADAAIDQRRVDPQSGVRRHAYGVDCAWQLGHDRLCTRGRRGFRSKRSPT